jgi:CO dehydrogenase maturation factor
MKVVVTGKGGAGKTTVAAILARVMARSGAAVLAMDGDPNPNLGISLGLGAEETNRVDAMLNAMLRESSEEPGGHTHGVQAVEALLTRLMVVGPDGVRLVQTGRIERPTHGCLCCGSHFTTRRLFQEVAPGGGVLIADLEPGVNDLIWVEPAASDVVIVVTEPYRKSLEVTTRTLQVAKDMQVGRVVVIANRLGGPEDGKMVREALSDVEVVEVPEDEALARAAARGASPVDEAPAGPAVSTLTGLASDLLRAAEVTA